MILKKTINALLRRNDNNGTGTDHDKVYSGPPFEREFMDVMTPDEAKKLLKIGLEPGELRTIPFTSMNLQFRSEWPIHAHGSNPKSRVPMPILESPLMEFLEAYKEHGKKILSDRLFRTTSYYRMWAEINKVGFRYDWYNYPETFAKSYPDEVIKNKMKSIISVYENIKKHGYRKGRFTRSIIMVLPEPFENMRFGFEHRIEGYEIWSGHHRAAALAALGAQAADVLVLEDIRRSEQHPDRQ